MNSGTFAGRIGRDAETKQTTKDSVTSFSLAVDVGWGDAKRTLWIGCSMWGQRGEKVAQYLTKGTPVTVSGDIDLRQYDKKDGTAGAEITCNVQRLTLQGKGATREDVDTPQTLAQKSNGKPPVADDFDGSSEIPF